VKIHASELAVSSEVTYKGSCKQAYKGSCKQAYKGSCKQEWPNERPGKKLLGRCSAVSGKLNRLCAIAGHRRRGCTPQERSNKILEHDQSTAGVICPPEIGSGMKVPTPKTGDNSVIPPPGAPGADPSVQPK
jgi:hypothetical protein